MFLSHCFYPFQSYCNYHYQRNNLFFILQLCKLHCGLASRLYTKYNFLKQPPRGVLQKRCSENIQQIYKRTSMSKQSNFIEITLRHGCSPVNLLHFFRTPFPSNTSGQLLLDFNVKFQMTDLQLMRVISHLSFIQHFLLYLNQL